MKFTHVLGALVLVAGMAACKKKEAKTGDTTAPAASGEAPKTVDKAADKPASKGRTVPNGNGLTAEAPARWVDNGIGGAAGFHLDGDAGGFQIREIAPEEAAKSMDDWKKETEEMLFQKWISADATADGFKALYTMDKIKMQGEEPVKDGSQFAFHVRRKLNGKVTDCYGTAAKQEDAQEAIGICSSVAAN
jgi:hypothetical protein